MVTHSHRASFVAASSRSLAILAGLAVLFCLTAPVPADVPAAKDHAKFIGQPTSLVVQPSSVALTGPRSVQQLVVTGKYADGSVRDLTPFVTAKAENDGLIAIEDN